jgi:hypothetical protein
MRFEAPGHLAGTRAGRQQWEGAQNGEVAVADALDRTALTQAVRACSPDAVVNLLTAIPRQLDPKRFEAQMAMSNRLRTEGTANLIAAAGNARFVTQGLAYGYSPAGGPVADEDQPLWAARRNVVSSVLLEHGEDVAGWIFEPGDGGTLLAEDAFRVGSGVVLELDTPRGERIHRGIDVWDREVENRVGRRGVVGFGVH